MERIDDLLYEMVNILSDIETLTIKVPEKARYSKLMNGCADLKKELEGHQFSYYGKKVNESLEQLINESMLIDKNCATNFQDIIMGLSAIEREIDNIISTELKTKKNNLIYRT